MAEFFESYVELARGDLDAARNLLRDPKHSGRAAFLVEQAAEKLIKAVLTVERIEFSASHQLGALADKLPNGHEWKTDFSSFDAFTTFATKFRYPTPSGNLPVNPGQDEIGAAIEEVASAVDDVLDWCRDHSKSSS